MKTKVKSYPALTQKAVYEAVAYHPDSVSRDSLAELFGLKNNNAHHLDNHLHNLVRAQKIARAEDNISRFAATQPLSDLVVARVMGGPSDGRSAVKIENVKFELDIPVTISQRQVKTHRLKYGDTFVAILERHKGYQLQAKFVERVSRSTRARLVGRFNQKAAPNLFAPIDKRIKTVFTASGNTPGILDPRTPYYAEITEKFDPHSPKLQLDEQKWDPNTGDRIHEVVASHYGVSQHHDRAASVEARRVTREMRRKTERDYDAMGRRDLSHIPFIVADPVNAQDHDDAIYTERLPEGYRTIVVVPDMPLYVRPGSVLDAAARERGFTHYFRDETYHMLPKQLSAQACSLLEGQLRPVIYVEQFRDLDGVPYDTDIGLGYIRSQRQMTYPQYQQYLGSNDPAAGPYRDLQNLLGMRQYNHEILMESSSTDHRCTEAQMIVQALMMDANKAVALFLERKRVMFPYRTHAGAVSPLAYAEQYEYLSAMGYDLPEHVEDLEPLSLNRMIAQAGILGDGDNINPLLLSLMQPAQYSTRPLEHWGISSKIYCHFTSPIRRYGDQLVQRAIHTALGDRDYGLSDDDEMNFEDRVRRMNYLESVNRNIQRDSERHYAVRDLHRLEGNSIHAILGGTSVDGIEIMLPSHGLKKTISLLDLPKGWRRGDGDGITDGKVYVPPGAKIRVMIADVQPHRAEWNISRLDAVKNHHSVDIKQKNGTFQHRNLALVPTAA